MSFFHIQNASNPNSQINLCIGSKILTQNAILLFINIFHILNPLENAERERERERNTQDEAL